MDDINDKESYNGGDQAFLNDINMDASSAKTH